MRTVVQSDRNMAISVEDTKNPRFLCFKRFMYLIKTNLWKKHVFLQPYLIMISI